MAFIMRVSMSSSVTVTGSAMLEYKNSNQIHKESKDGHDQKSFVFHFRRLDQPLNSLGEDEERDEQEEEAVNEAGQNFSSHIPVGVALVRPPFCDHTCNLKEAKYVFPPFISTSPYIQDVSKLWICCNFFASAGIKVINTAFLSWRIEKVYSNSLSCHQRIIPATHLEF